MAKCEIKDLAGKGLGEFELPSELFDVELSPGLVHQVAVAAAAARRAGTHSTLTRTTVNGSNRKPFRQKGTGGARQGTIHGPHMRGGAISWGPHPRSYCQRVPRKMRRAALRQMLSQRARESRCLIVNAMDLPNGKTRGLLQVTRALQVEKSRVLFIVPEQNENLRQAASNLDGARVALANHISAALILDSEYLVMTPQAVDRMKEVFGSDQRPEKREVRA